MDHARIDLDVAETVSLAAGNRSDADTRRGDHARQPADVSDRHLPAHELVGAPIPSKLLTIARDDRAVAALARRVARQLFMGAVQGRTDFDPWEVPIRSIEGGRARIRYVVRRMLAPTMGDYELIPLPASLFPLYWVIRPFRMAVQYGPRLLRGSSSASHA
jgi:hypothetical protein